MDVRAEPIAIFLSAGASHGGATSASDHCGSHSNRGEPAGIYARAFARTPVPLPDLMAASTRAVAKNSRRSSGRRSLRFRPVRTGLVVVLAITGLFDY